MRTVDYIQSRELGFSEWKPSCTSCHIVPQGIFKVNIMQSTFDSVKQRQTAKKTSNLVSIISQKNYLVTLSRSGALTLYNLEPVLKQTELTTPDLFVVRIFQSDEKMICLYYEKHTKRLRVSLYEEISLQDGRPVSREVFAQSYFQLENLIFTDETSGLLILRTSEEVQIWDIFQEKMVTQVSISSDMECHYSHSSLFVWSCRDGATLLHIVNIQTGAHTSYALKGMTGLVSCDFIHDSLLLVVENSLPQLLNVKEGTFSVMSKLSVKKVYYLVSKSDAVVFFNDRTLALASNSSRTLGEFSDPMFWESGGMLIIYERTTKTVHLIDLESFEVIKEIPCCLYDPITAAMYNSDTGEIFLGTIKNQIICFE